MSHVHHRLFYHFVWATWNREPLLSHSVEQRAYALIQDGCCQFAAELHALGGIEDHVHLLVTLPRTFLISDFMKIIKGLSSKTLNEIYGTDIWHFKWQGGYGVDTVSPSHLTKVKAYIQNQKQHHAENTLWSSCELMHQE